MATERLSRLQKWILIQTYKKVLLRDVSDLRFVNWTKDWPTNDEIRKVYWPALWRDEIVRNFFDCKYGTVPNKYHVTVSRSLQNLYRKDLIEEIWLGWTKCWGIKLTADGIKKALMLMDERQCLKVNNNGIQDAVIIDDVSYC